MGTFGGTEILVILLVILLFFGAKKIPELARGIGQGMKEFRKASDEIKKELEEGEREGLNANSDDRVSNTESHQKSNKEN